MAKYGKLSKQKKKEEGGAIRVGCDEGRRPSKGVKEALGREAKVRHDAIHKPAAWVRPT